MSELRFAAPAMAQLFWLVALVMALLIWLERRGGSDLERLVSRALQERLVTRPAYWRSRLRLALLGLGAAALVLALMRPQWGLRAIETPRVGAELMICLDVSRSMLAEDVAPNRLDRAKAEIADLLPFLDGDQVGLIAFAGRATVLSPLTPDFSFLRLALDGAGPGSVTRGGTRLEEPLRKALAGFGPPGEVARAILLITDGEDHDSFPLDAAKQAAELGVRIIAIGFGDEVGSEVLLSDPTTGARTLLRDADGRPVRSRLDGELLRELALATGGAYVPAGTGLLDLEAIYQAHIAPMLRGVLDGRSRRVRDEAYQWALLIAWLALVAGAAVSGGRGQPASSLAASVALVCCLSSAALPFQAGAQDAEADPAPLGEVEAPATPEDPAPEPAVEPSQPAPQEARALYNQALAALESGDWQEADRQLSRARREARDDGELRFRAAYNLGWTAAREAAELESSDPQAAIGRLAVAADWFRHALRLQPQDVDARHNLEVALRLSLLLADRLARESEGDLRERLARLVQDQRAQVGAVAAVLERFAELAPASDDPDLRRLAKDLATSQRQRLQEAQELASRTGNELDALAARPPEERTSEDEMRGVALSRLLDHLHRARERMGQSRRELRRRDAERAYRRSSAALDELKRALDQLRDPRALLDALVGETGELLAGTQQLAAARVSLGAETGARAPAWLTAAALVETQAALRERTHELDERLAAGVESAGAPAADPRPFAEARPFVSAAHFAFELAEARIASEELSTAAAQQGRALESLREARERFLDVRGLIEALHRDQVRIVELLGAPDEALAGDFAEYLPPLRAVQAKNRARGERLDGMLEEQALATEATPPDEEGKRDIQLERFELARELLDEARSSMQGAHDALGREGSARSFDRPAAQTSSDRARAAIEALRRIFFTLVEELRDVATQQVELRDASQDAVAREAPPAALGSRQTQLAGRAETIAQTLEAQSHQEGSVPDDASAAETVRRLREAAEHVLLAHVEMSAAAESLAVEPLDSDAVLVPQETAVEEIELALALLVPPEEREQQQQQQQQDEQASQEQGEEQREQDAGREGADPAQLLQAVRDRAAQRQRERSERQRMGNEPVERDW